LRLSSDETRPIFEFSDFQQTLPTVADTLEKYRYLRQGGDNLDNQTVVGTAGSNVP